MSKDGMWRGGSRGVTENAEVDPLLYLVVASMLLRWYCTAGDLLLLAFACTACK
jgi:hypothetical protein